MEQKIQLAQNERNLEEIKRWHLLLKELPPNLEFIIVREQGTGPVGIYSPRYKFTIQLTHDKDMLYWSPDKPQVLAQGLASPQEAAKFIQDFVKHC